MAYRTDLKIKIPQIQGKIIQHHKKESTYVEYIRERDYNSEKQNANFKKVSIGKVINGEPEYMYPNDNYFKYFDIEVPAVFSGSGKRSSLISIGTNIIIDKILDEYKLKELLKKCFGEEQSRFILDMLSYSIITEKNVGQHYDSYARNHILHTKYMHIYSDSSISSFMNKVSKDEQNNFYKLWNNSEFVKKDEKVHISYDSSNKNIQAGNINIIEPGNAKQKVGCKIFNYSIAFNQTNKIPLCMETYNGSIIDVSQLESAIKKIKSFGYTNFCFILDRGYFSADNIEYMLNGKIDFLMMMKGHKDVLAWNVLKYKGTFENDLDHEIEHYGLNGITVKDKVFINEKRTDFKDLKNKDFYIHIYYSAKRNWAETEVLRQSIKLYEIALNNALNTKKTFRKPITSLFDLVYTDGVLTSFTRNKMNIKKAFDVCGYFGIITSYEANYDETLTLYKGRDSSEKLFSATKSFLGGKSVRVHSREALDTKMFIEFLALIVRNKIYNDLHDHKILEKRKNNYLTVPAAIKQLEMIELVRGGDDKYLLDHALTRQQKDILAAFDMDEESIKKQAENYGHELVTVLEKDKVDEFIVMNKGRVLVKLLVIF